MIEVGYRGFIKMFTFKVDFIEIENRAEIGDLRFSFAKGNHSIKDYAIKIENNGKSVCYSGDGDYTNETEKLYKGCDLLIHEAYFYDKKMIGHGCIIDLIKMAERNNVKCLALTHINRNLRKKGFNLPKSKIKIIIPKPFDTLDKGV